MIMALIILDLGSGNSCRNDPAYARLMVDTVIQMDKKRHQVMFKWQLEKNDPPGQRKLERKVFAEIHAYTLRQGYASGSSVFDQESLAFLLGCGPSFVKIACRPDLYPLTAVVPRGIPVFLSADQREKHEFSPPATVMLCIPEYPAKLEDYERAGWCRNAVSDHTPLLELWRKYEPKVWEKHFVLQHSDDNPDAGIFAITPDLLAEVIG